MKRPNILFIAVDDLRCELGAYGQSHVLSPHIDKIAEEGVKFEHAYCQSGVCNPSRTSLLTGLRPDKTKVWDLHTHFRDNLPDLKTLPQHLSEHGYLSTAIGKIFHNDLPDPKSWSEPKIHLDGFPYDPDAVYLDNDELDWLEVKKESLEKEGLRAKYLDPLGKWYLKAGAYECPDVPDNAYYDGAQTDAALDKLEDLSKRDVPFFFGIGYYRPHLPFNVPKKYWDLYDRESIPLTDNNHPPKGAPQMALNNLRELRGYRDFKEVGLPSPNTLGEAEARILKHGYLASISYVDAQIGKLTKKLEDLGIADETIVVLWGDNGYKLGDHGSWCKMTNFEVDTRVPLIIKAPTLKSTQDQIVEFVDVYPTICDLAEIPAPKELDGRSLLPLMKGDQQHYEGKAFSQFLRSGIWQCPDGKDYMGYTVRSNSFRYVEWYSWPEKVLVDQELYDHRSHHREDLNRVEEDGLASVVTEHEGLLRQVFEHLPPSRALAK